MEVDKEYFERLELEVERVNDELVEARQQAEYYKSMFDTGGVVVKIPSHLLHIPSSKLFAEYELELLFQLGKRFSFLRDDIMKYEPRQARALFNGWITGNKHFRDIDNHKITI